MAGKIRLIGAVGIKVRPDTTEFKKELREQIKTLPDYDIEVNVDADTTIAKRKLEKLKAEAEKNSLTLTLDDNVFDDIQNAQKQIKKAIASLSKETITVGLNSKELEAKLKNLQMKARGAKVNMEYNDDKAGYEAILSKIRTIRRQKMVKELEFKTDNKSLAETERKFEQLLANLPTPVKTLTIKHRNDHESLTAAIAQIDQAIADLKQVEINPKLTWTELMAEKKKLQKELDTKPLIMTVNEDKESYEAVLKKITDLQKQAVATEVSFTTDEQSLADAAATMRAKIAALTPKPNITFTYENDTRGMRGALDEVEKKLAELSRIKLVADLDEEGLLKAKEELENQLSTSTFGINVDSGDLDALKAETKKLDEMLKEFAIKDIAITVENTPESMERAKAELEELIKEREAPIRADPITWEAAMQLAYTSRARDVPFYVRINQRSLAIAEGVLQSLAGINTLRAGGRGLESLITKFDTISIKAGLLGALIGGLANTFLYLTTALFPVGEGIFNVVGLLAMAPAALAAVTATAVINIAAWQNFGDAVEGSAEALAKLPPEAQRTALALRGTWTEMQKPIQASFWKGMGDSMATSFQAFLPVVTEGLTAAAEHVGRFGAGVFKSFEKIALSGDLKAMFAGLSGMFDNAAGAAEPLFDALNRIGLRGSEYLPQFGQWLTDISIRFDEWIKKADETGKINVWIEQGVQSLKDMWTLGRGITEMFQGIGMAAKLAGAGGLGDVARRFDEIGTMMKGEPFQSRLGTIFNGARAGASDLNVGVKHLGESFGKASVFVANMLQELGKLGGGILSGIATTFNNIQFQTGVLDGLEGMNEMAGELRGGFHDLGTVIGNLGQIAGAAFSSIGPVINQVVEVLAGITASLGPELMTLIPTLMGMVGGFISSLSGPAQLMADTLAAVLSWVNSLPGPLAGLVASFAAFIFLAGKIGPMFQAKPGGLLEKIKYDFQQADTARDKFQVGAKGIGAGLLSAVGGPWGIAIGLMTTGLALMGQRAAESKARVDAYTASLDANTGAMTANTFANAAKNLMDEGGFWEDRIRGAQKTQDVITGLGLSFQSTAEIAAKGGPEYDALLAKLDEFPGITGEGGKTMAGFASAMGISEEAASRFSRGDIIHLKSRLSEVNGETSNGVTNFGHLTDAITKLPLTPAQKRVEDFNNAMRLYNDTTASADSRTRSLKSALDILSGKELSLEEAQLKVNDAMRAAAGTTQELDGKMVQVGGTFRDNNGALLNFNGVIDQVTGKIDTAGNAGAGLYRNLSEVSTGVLETATRMKDAGEPIENITKFLEGSRAAYVAQAEQAGLSGELVGKAYDHMVQANPKELATLISAVGTEDATGKVRTFASVVDEIDARRAVAEIAGDNQPLADALSTGFMKLSEWDAAVGIATAGLDPTQANATRAKLTDDLIALANSNPTVKAHLDPAILNQRKAEIEQSLRDLAGQRPTPQVDAETAAAKTKLDAVNSALNGITDRKATVTIDYNAVGSALDQGLPIPRSANGSILDGRGRGVHGFNPQYFANGGFYSGKPPAVKKFANGGIENHVAQIARGATPYRVWAEPETGGEAYIPLSQAKRGRSTQILEQVAKQFGYNLTKAQAFADGGVVNGGNARATSGLQVHIDTFNQNANDTIEDVGRGIMRQVRTAGMAGIMEGI